MADDGASMERFWQIVEQSRSDWDPALLDGNMGRQAQRLKELLSPLPPQDVVQFDTAFWQCMADSYRWDLWGVAFILAEGVCSDDWFDYFRFWLISMGKEVFEAALKNPDSLAEPARQPGVEDVFFEEFGMIASTVYCEKTGEDIPPVGSEYPRCPSGEEFEFTTEQLAERYPVTWKRYAWE
jgi:hypothetical protein